MSITPEILEKIGLMLYGEHWKTSLSEALGLSSPRRMRDWVNNKTAIPQTLKPELIALLEEQQTDIIDLIITLKKD